LSDFELGMDIRTPDPDNFQNFVETSLFKITSVIKFS